MSDSFELLVLIAVTDYEFAREHFRSRHMGKRAYACFFAQQCVEKYLKLWLLFKGQEPPRTHDLNKLAELILPIEPIWEGMRPALGALSAMAIAPRYAEELPDLEEARYAMKVAREVRTLIRERLGLD